MQFKEIYEIYSPPPRRLAIVPRPIVFIEWKTISSPSNLIQSLYRGEKGKGTDNVGHCQAFIDGDIKAGGPFRLHLHIKYILKQKKTETVSG